MHKYFQYNLGFVISLAYLFQQTNLTSKHGYVGNKCSVFGLQTLGIEVDPINTVHLSNHTGYPTWKGEVLDGDQLTKLFEGLVSNNLDDYSHLLTGYVRTPSVLRSLLQIYQRLKQKNADLLFFCDPVLGDNGRLYVPSELVEIYRDEVLPQVDVLFPNQTEAEHLSGIQIKNEKDAIEAIVHFHSLGISTVIITSLFLSPNQITIIASTKHGKRYKMSVPLLPFSFTGTGDLFSALILAWTHKGHNLKEALEKTVNTLQAILSRTMAAQSKELRLIQSRSDIEDPPQDYKAEEL